MSHEIGSFTPLVRFLLFLTSTIRSGFVCVFLCVAHNARTTHAHCAFCACVDFFLDAQTHKSHQCACGFVNLIIIGVGIGLPIFISISVISVIFSISDIGIGLEKIRYYIGFYSTILVHIRSYTCFGNLKGFKQGYELGVRIVIDRPQVDYCIGKIAILEIIPGI